MHVQVWGLKLEIWYVPMHASCTYMYIATKINDRSTLKAHARKVQILASKTHAFHPCCRATIPPP